MSSSKRPIGTCVLSGMHLYDHERVMLLPLVPSALAHRRIPAMPAYTGTTWLGDTSHATGLFQPLTLPLVVRVSPSHGRIAELVADAPAAFLAERIGDVREFAECVLFGSSHAGVLRFAPRRVRERWDGSLYGTLASVEAWDHAVERMRSGEADRAAQIRREEKEYQHLLGRDRDAKREGDASNEFSFDVCESNMPAAFVEADAAVVQAHLQRFKKGRGIPRLSAEENARLDEGLRQAMPAEGITQTYSMARGRSVWLVTLHVEPGDVRMQRPVVRGVQRSSDVRLRVPRDIPTQREPHASFTPEVWAALRAAGWRPDRSVWERRFDSPLGPMARRLLAPEMRRIYRGALFREPLRAKYLALSLAADAMSCMGRLFMPLPTVPDLDANDRAFVRNTHALAFKRTEVL